MKRLLDELAALLEAELKAELQRQGHAVTETLVNSIKVAARETVSGFEIIGRAVYYAKFVEQGRKPGARGVPVDSLVEWIRRRKIVIEGMKERSIAFMFQGSIRRKGIPPALFINKTLTQSEDMIDDYVTKAAGLWMDSYIEKLYQSWQ